MSDNYTYLITGANRGIGLTLTTLLLLRPQTTVIATIRTASTSTSDLTALLLGTGSKLIIIPLDFSSPSTAQTTFTDLPAVLCKEHGITQINTIIANAGTGTSFASTLNTSAESLAEHFEINTLGPILLYQALHPMLPAEGKGDGEGREAKFILISSSLGSIGAMESAVPSLAYGFSKAAADYFVRKVHFEEQDITTLAVHPGWVKTANGQAFADSIGVAQPPLSVEESAKGVLAQIDGATKATTSGSFLSYDGSVIPW